MKHAALAALLMVLVPLQASALDNEELLALVAMPLAVAAASDVTGVPVGELSHFVATLNRAQVQPTQVVQVVRYAPAALVVTDQQPTFVEYVDTEVDRGIVGNQLVTVIEDRYRTYDLEPQFVTLEEPATTYVVRDDYIPPVVVTRVAQYAPAYAANDTGDLLSLIAMPLAVAAVADITDVPFSDLSSLVASLNAARLPPMQVVEVLRYTPVVLANDYERPRFVQYIRTRVDDGVTGRALINVIDDRLRTYDVVPQFGALQPSQVTVIADDDDEFFPPVVTTRVAQARSHPHGGPPGQLKKELGVQTGAEIVHGTRPGAVARDRVVTRDRVLRPRPVDRDDDRDRVRATRRHEPSHARKREDGREARGKARRVEQPRVERQQRLEAPKGKRQKVERQMPAHVERGGGGTARGGGHASGQGKGKGKGKG